MTPEQKEQIREALTRYTAKFSTQLAASRSLQGVSPTMISQVKNNKWQVVTERMWQHIARQVGFYCGNEWQQADTGCYLLLRILFGDAQRYAMAYGVAIQTGLGKTFTAKHYARENTHAHYIGCEAYMNRKNFISKLLQTLGGKPGGTADQMMDEIISRLENQEEPVLIIDDAHKLKDRVLHFAITLYKRLINHCGIVILGNDELRTRVVEGARMNKELYSEVYNTIGRRFVTLGQAGPRDVELICRANAMNNEAIISEIKDCCKGNLHYATELIHKAKLQESKETILD
ncbi:MAG: AAA family ATPase [Flavipsychrobacter sp.]